MHNVTISIECAEGTVIYVPPRTDTDPPRWRLLPKNGKGTRPVPQRLLRQARKAQADEQHPR